MSAVGPLYCLIAILIFPIFLSLPSSLICSEMGSYFPLRGSTIMWAASISDAMQSQQKFNNTRKHKIMTKTSRVLVRLYANTLFMKEIATNAIPLALIFGYVQTLIPQMEDWRWTFLVSGIFVGLCIVLNMYGLDIAGWT